MEGFSAKDKVIVVTGGASGIGEAMCKKFAAEGAKVVVVDMNHAEGTAIAKAIGGSFIFANCGSEMDLRKVISKTEMEVGPIDAFIANAGIPSNGSIDVPNDEWERIWKVNTMQHVFVARHLFPRMIERGGGYFVITASAAGLLTQVGSLPYSVTKHAAVSIAEWFAITYAESGIKVSCLCPQAVRSGMTGDSEGGVAGGDGMLEAGQVADDVYEAMKKGEFLILPHKEVLKYFQRKSNNYDRWIAGMQRLHQSFGKLMMMAPPITNAKL